MHFTGTFIPGHVTEPAEVSSLACPSSVEGTISSASGARQFGCVLQSISPGWCKPRIIYHLGVWWMRWYELVALVHYCWNQLISLLAASAESLGKTLPALRHLSLLGQRCCASAGTVSNQHRDSWDFATPILWSSFLLCQSSVDTPDCLLQGPEAASPVTPRQVMQIPQISSLRFACLLCSWFAAPRYLHLWACLFSAPDPTASSPPDRCPSHGAQARLAR